MNLFRKIISGIHNILGLVLCVLFLMWFVSGIVMIYHSFPRASQEYKLRRQQPLSAGNMVPVDSLRTVLPDTAKLRSMSVEMRFDRPVVQMRGEGVPSALYIDNLERVEDFDEAVRQKTIQLWCSAPIQKVDTLHKVDQWIPFGRNNDEMPVYKYYFDDKEAHQLYMTSKDGKVLQFTDKDSRFWAWLGAIPHWVYFTSFRQHQELWIEFVKWSAGIGCIMCLMGFILAFIDWKKQKNKGFFHSPYRKRWYKWHFVSGVVFGLFAITFAFSGMMSLRDIPDWLKKAPKTERKARGGMFPSRMSSMLPLNTYKLDYRQILSQSDSVKSITWASWNKYPYYKVQYNYSSVNIDASDSTQIKVFELTEDMVRKDVARQLGDSVQWTMDLLTTEDADYYGRRKERIPLPVYRIVVDDNMHTHMYYSPQTLRKQTVDDDGRTRRFLYSGLHSLNIKFLTDRPILWNIVMYTLMFGGTFLSLTGIVLSVKWIIRKIKKLVKIIRK